MLLAMFAIVSWGQTTETITVSTNVDFPDHVYKMKTGNNTGYWVTSYTSPTATESNAAWFAFYAVEENGATVENAYKILCVTSGKWLTYEKASGYSNDKNFVKFADSMEAAQYWHAVKQDGKDALGEVYCIAPYNTNGAAGKYMNWHGGVDASTNVLDNTNTTMGLWEQNAEEDPGSAWIITEVSEEVTMAEYIDRVQMGYAEWQTLCVGTKFGQYAVIADKESDLGTAETALENATTLEAALDARTDCYACYTLPDANKTMTEGKYYRIQSTTRGTYTGVEGVTLNMRNKAYNESDPTQVWQYVKDGDNYYLRNVYNGLYPQSVPMGSDATTQIGLGKNNAFTFALHSAVPANGATEWNIFFGGNQVNVEDASHNHGVNHWWEDNSHHHIYEVEAPMEELCVAWFNNNTINLIEIPATVDFELVEGATVIKPSEISDNPADINADIANYKQAYEAVPEGDVTSEKIQKIYVAKVYETNRLRNYQERVSSYGALLSVVYTAPTSEWGTIIMPINVARPEGWTVDTCSTLSGNVLVLVESETIVKNKPYVIQVSEAKQGALYQFIGFSDGAATTNQTAGLLTGVLEEGTQVPSGSYILAKYQNKVGFYRVAEGTNYSATKYKCYLTLPAETPDEARYAALFFDDTITGIEDITEAEDAQNGNGRIFNMAGQRLNRLQKGLNIVNGKIVLK